MEGGEFIFPQNQPESPVPLLYSSPPSYDDISIELVDSPGGSSNSSFNETYDYIPYTERPETYIIPVLFAIIFIIGVIGNGTLVLIFLRNAKIRNVPNMYICSLAIGDLLVILFCVPFTSTVYTLESWPYGEVICKFSEFIKDVSIGVSVFTLTALSADRYFAIVDPMRKLTGHSANRITTITITGIWLLSLLISIPSLIFSHLKVFEDPLHSFQVCYPFAEDLNFNYPKVMVLFKFFILYAVPLTFIGTFYIGMARHLYLSTKSFPLETYGQSKQIQGRKKVAKMVLSFVVIFALCFAPSQIFLVWFYTDPNSETNFNLFWHILRMVGFTLGFANSCINPINLYIISGTFRKQFNQNLFCCRCKGPSWRRETLPLCGCATVSTSEQARGTNLRRHVEIGPVIPPPLYQIQQQSNGRHPGERENIELRALPSPPPPQLLLHEPEPRQNASPEPVIDPETHQRAKGYLHPGWTPPSPPPIEKPAYVQANLFFLSNFMGKQRKPIK